MICTYHPGPSTSKHQPPHVRLVLEVFRSSSSKVSPVMGSVASYELDVAREAAGAEERGGEGGEERFCLEAVVEHAIGLEVRCEVVIGDAVDAGDERIYKSRRRIPFNSANIETYGEDTHQEEHSLSTSLFLYQRRNHQRRNSLLKPQPLQSECQRMSCLAEE